SLACSESKTNAPAAGDLHGSVGVALQIAGGQTINTVTYQITGPNSFSKSGTIDVSHSSAVSAVISPPPVGTGYQIALTGTTTDGATMCAGSGSFDVVASATSMVTVHLDCHVPPTTGRVSVNGTLNICPILDGVTATPAEVFVGSAISLTVAAHDADSGPSALSYVWSAPSGTFTSLTAANPNFTCTAGGPVTLTVKVSDGDPAAACAPSASVTVTCTNTPLQADVQNVVVIFAENRSFDGLFGNFPGAHGLSEVVDASGTPTAAYVPQKDRDGTTVLAKLPQTWGGATAAGNPTVVTQAQTDNLANSPFPLETGFVANGGPMLTTLDVTRDIAHRFFENAMEINGGTSDMYAAWEDAGGITMGHFDNSHKSLYSLAQQYVLADNFFQGAYGGSFLTHQYLICACAPQVPSSFITSNTPSVNVLGTANGKGVPQLATNTSSPASALTGTPSFKTGNIAPLDYFGMGDGYRAVNTMQPPFQPSGNFPAAGATDLRYANPAAATTLPAQTQTTMGDLLSARGIDWAWYATSWNDATTDGQQPSTATHAVIYAPSSPRAVPDFQAHHHPYNYYARFDPATHAAERAAHLKDYTQLVADAAAGTLPPVAWYKPAGGLNQHPGYANIDDGDAHMADLVAKLQASPQWAHMVIVVTYDEYGGQWDHVAPPKGDLLGPGTRVPAIIISPYAKKGTVDHTQYDSSSTLRLITKRWALPVLPGLSARDAALVANGGTPMGDLTSALTLP
ncbi:MAG: acid phosphatase, partial [Verrucomicrobiota bacterium]